MSVAVHRPGVTSTLKEHGDHITVGHCQGTRHTAAYGNENVIISRMELIGVNPRFLIQGRSLMYDVTSLCH